MLGAHPARMFLTPSQPHQKKQLFAFISRTWTVGAGCTNGAQQCAHAGFWSRMVENHTNLSDLTLEAWGAIRKKTRVATFP